MASGDLSPALSNLLAAPPFICAAVAVLAFTRWSDAMQQRLNPIMYGLAILCSGLLLVVLLPQTWHVARYVAICVLFSGSYVASPLTVAWLSDNTPEPGKRAVVLGINGWGNIAGVTSAFLFTTHDASNGYTLSFSVTLSCALTSLCGYLFFTWLLKRETRWRKEVLHQWTESERKQELQHGNAPLRSSRSCTALLSKHVFDHSRTGEERITYQFTF